MKEVIVKAGPICEVIDSPIPKPGADQVLIKVAIAAANPKDWKIPEWTGKEANQGDDGAGIVEAVGDNVTTFKKGDRVAGMHIMMQPGGTYAEYALLAANTAFHIPSGVSFEEAATVPLTAATAAASLYSTTKGLGLPLPIQPVKEPLPLVIYGASGSVGAYALMLARKANIHPLICVAGGGAKTIEHLLDRSKGDTIVDYRKGDAAVVEGIKAALGGSKLRYGLDTAAHGKSSVNIAEAMEGGGKVGRTLPGEGALPNGVETIEVGVGIVHGNEKDLGSVVFQLLETGLKHGWLEARPYEVVRGGLNGVEQALKDLKAGKASAVKYIFRIDETDGIDGMS